MANPIKLIESIYKKDGKIPDDITVGDIIVINKMLSYDTQNIDFISKIFEYQFYIAPLHYYILLYFGIRKAYKVPYFQSVKKNNLTLDEFYGKLCYLFGWSSKEFQHHKTLVDLLIDKQEWSNKIGLK